MTNFLHEKPDLHLVRIEVLGVMRCTIDRIIFDNRIVSAWVLSDRNFRVLADDICKRYNRFSKTSLKCSRSASMVLGQSFALIAGTVVLGVREIEALLNL